MAVIHIVQLKFKPSVDEATVRGICDHLLSLKDKCIHPESNKPYIKSASGGKDNSPEGLQNGFTHAFVVDFEKKEDRDYYLNKDPAHLAFVSSAKDTFGGVQVLDFVPGVY